MAKAAVYLIPNTLGGETLGDILPQEVIDKASSLRNFAVEDIKSARRLLRKMDRTFPIDDSLFVVLNKNTKPEDLGLLMKQLKAGIDVGIISEAGCPGIADPGALLVSMAHEKGFHIKPMVGPSSILLTLIGSGFNGQHFTFNGYLPKDQKDRVKRLKDFEQSVRRNNTTQIFMDTPFRNIHVLEDLLNELHDDTLLCIASNLTLPTERIETMTIAKWRDNAYDIGKVNTMFALGRLD